MTLPHDNDPQEDLETPSISTIPDPPIYEPLEDEDVYISKEEVLPLPIRPVTPKPAAQLTFGQVVQSIFGILIIIGFGIGVDRVLKAVNQPTPIPTQGGIPIACGGPGQRSCDTVVIQGNTGNFWINQTASAAQTATQQQLWNNIGSTQAAILQSTQSAIPTQTAWALTSVPLPYDLAATKSVALGCTASAAPGKEVLIYVGPSSKRGVYGTLTGSWNVIGKISMVVANPQRKRLPVPGLISPMKLRAGLNSEVWLLIHNGSNLGATWVRRTDNIILQGNCDALPYVASS